MAENLPVYIQIHDQIKANIENETYKIGDRLPSERELAKQFGVSRMTLRQAIQTLADEGILERKIGSGTYVTAPSSSEMEKLQLEGHETILRMERIRYADDVPICFEVASIPEKLIYNFSKEEIISSLYHVLEEKGGHKIGAASQTISAMIASEQIADYLQIKRGDAILRMRQITCFENGQPFEYVRTQYVGNRFEFYLEK